MLVTEKQKKVMFYYNIYKYFFMYNISNIVLKKSEMLKSIKPNYIDKIILIYSQETLVIH